MTSYATLPSHLNFPVSSRCVFKTFIHRKRQWIVLRLLKKFFLFKKDAFYIAHACRIFHASLSIIFAI